MIRTDAQLWSPASSPQPSASVVPTPSSPPSMPLNGAVADDLSMQSGSGIELIACQDLQTQFSGSSTIDSPSGPPSNGKFLF